MTNFKSLLLGLSVCTLLWSGHAFAHRLWDDLQGKLEERGCSEHVSLAKTVVDQLETGLVIPKVNWREIPVTHRDPVYHAIDQYIAARMSQLYSFKVPLNPKNSLFQGVQDFHTFLSNAQNQLSQTWSETFSDLETIPSDQPLTQESSS